MQGSGILLPSTPPDDITMFESLLAKKSSRKVWGKSTALDGSERGSPIPEAFESPSAQAKGSPLGRASVRNDTASSALKYSQLAKYAPHHLPDPNSRCASGMAVSAGPRMRIAARQ